jgi:nucleoid-associated protein YgaU
MAIAAAQLNRATIPARRASALRRRQALARRRLVALAVLVALAAAALGVISASRSEASVDTAVRTVVVAPGDTLWDIAQGLVGPGESTHVLVAEIAARNGVDAASLRPGSVLEVPSR